MIGTIGLHMSVVFIEPQIQETCGSLVAPSRAHIVVPRLTCSRLKRHTIDSHAPPIPHTLHWLIYRHRLQSHTKRIALRLDRIWIATTRKLSWLVIGNAVALDHTKSRFGFDLHLRRHLTLCRLHLHQALRFPSGLIFDIMPVRMCHQK